MNRQMNVNDNVNRENMNRENMYRENMNRGMNFGMNSGMSSRTHGAGASLLRDIQALCFAKTEATLYLDTHPDNRAALDYFYDICDKLEALTEKYEAEYGPLTAGGVQGTTWHWIDGPWPWQNTTDMNDMNGDSGLNCRGNKRED